MPSFALVPGPVASAANTRQVFSRLRAVCAVSERAQGPVRAAFLSRRQRGIAHRLDERVTKITRRLPPPAAASSANFSVAVVKVRSFICGHGSRRKNAHGDGNSKGERRFFCSSKTPCQPPSFSSPPPLSPPLSAPSSPSPATAHSQNRTSPPPPRENDRSPASSPPRSKSDW